MRFRGELRCLHCARTAGTIEWSEDQPARRRLLSEDGRRRRCPHCAGPVYLEEAEPVRTEPVVGWEKPRRGRPPKLRRDQEPGVGGPGVALAAPAYTDGEEAEGLIAPLPLGLTAWN